MESSPTRHAAAIVSHTETTPHFGASKVITMNFFPPHTVHVIPLLDWSRLQFVPHFGDYRSELAACVEWQWTLWGILFTCQVDSRHVQMSLRFEDRALVDLIYSCPISKRGRDLTTCQGARGVATGIQTKSWRHAPLCTWFGLSYVFCDVEY